MRRWIVVLVFSLLCGTVTWLAFDRHALQVQLQRQDALYHRVVVEWLVDVAKMETKIAQCQKGVETTQALLWQAPLLRARDPLAGER